MEYPDYLGSRHYTTLLANRIRAYYRKKDIEVDVRVEKEGTVYVVRSNLSFSFPPPRAP